MLVLLAGAAVRIAVYLQNRSLFLDEANLARNVAERGFAGFFRPLDYEQFAPPLFLVWTKAHTLLLGNTEYALRLLPLLAGLASLYLFWRLAEDLIPAFPARLLAVWIFAFNVPLIRYATECKQYGTDVLAAVLLIFLALRQGKQPFRWREAWVWGLLGLLGIGFSMPVVFVLAGAGLYWIALFYKKDNLTALAPVGLSIGIWLLGFGVFFLTLLKPDADSAYLQHYHDPYFLPLLPASAAEWRQAGELLMQLVRSFSGATVVALATGTAGLAAAWIHWLRRRKPEGLLWTIPLLACLAASALHYYSLISRLVLFLMPLLLLTSCFGWSLIWEKAAPRLKPLLAVALVLTGSLHFSLPFLWKPLHISEVRPALAYVERQLKPGEALYLGQWAIPAFSFYKKHHPRPVSLPEPASASTIGEAPVWLVFTHLVAPKEVERMEAELAPFRERGRLEETFRSKATLVWRWSPAGYSE
jgi:hypothetical protein